MANPTRKSIGDGFGYKSVYVIERLTVGNFWVPFYCDVKTSFVTLSSAENGLETIKSMFLGEHFRIRLYARVEEKNA